MSWSVPLSAWPMCSSPVTFGGGTAMLYFGFELPASAWKSWASSQRAYQRASTACGSYAVSIEWCWLICACGCLRLGWGGAGARGAELADVRRPGYVRSVCGVFLATHGARDYTPGQRAALSVFCLSPWVSMGVDPGSVVRFVRNWRRAVERSDRPREGSEGLPEAAAPAGARQRGRVAASRRAGQDRRDADPKPGGAVDRPAPQHGAELGECRPAPGGQGRPARRPPSAAVGGRARARDDQERRRHGLLHAGGDGGVLRVAAGQLAHCARTGGARGEGPAMTAGLNEYRPRVAVDTNVLMEPEWLRRLLLAADLGLLD